MTERTVLRGCTNWGSPDRPPNLLSRRLSRQTTMTKMPSSSTGKVSQSVEKPRIRCPQPMRVTDARFFDTLKKQGGCERAVCSHHCSTTEMCADDDHFLLSLTADLLHQCCRRLILLSIDKIKRAETKMGLFTTV